MRAGYFCVAVAAFTRSTVVGLNAVAPGRTSVERGGVLYFTKGPTEPPFAVASAPFSSPKTSSPPLCVIARIENEGYTLGRPGYTMEKKGPGDTWLKELKLSGDERNATLTIINATTISCSMPPVLTAG
eukprot:gene4340-4034_t